MVPEFFTHENQRVVTLLDDELQAALLGSKTVKAALNDAQTGATRILRPFQQD